MNMVVEKNNAGEDLVPIMSKLVLPPVGLEGQVFRGSAYKISNQNMHEDNLFVKGAGIELPDINGRS